jgi:hypothetical protein
MQKRRLTRRAPRLLAIVGVLVGLALPAAAQAQINPEQACKDDAIRLCNNYIPDRQRVGACLRRNARSLNRDCRTLVLGGTGATRHRATRYHHHHYRY